MESDLTQSAIFYRLWAWFDARKKHVLGGLLAAAVLCLAFGFYLWRQSEKQASANEALSKIIVQGVANARTESAESFLKVAAEHPDTEAAGRALLMAGAKFFADGKYPEARAQFEKNVAQFPRSTFEGQALLGVAASLEAEGKTEAALKAYKDVVDRHATENVAAQARLSMARLYEELGKLELARDFYKQVAGAAQGSIGSEAAMQFDELLKKHPELAPPAPVPVPAPVGSAPTGAGSTNLPILKLN